MQRFSASKKLLRLISARYDMANALDAYSHFTGSLTGTPIAEYFFCAMVVVYGRPFTENHGLGNIKCEYPNYPDFPDQEMNDRHLRLMDIRNKFLAHSSAEGTKIIVIPPRTSNPLTGIVSNQFDHNVGKRTFLDPRFADWLVKVVYEFKGRLDTDTKKQMETEFSGQTFTGPFEIDTTWNDFKWTDAKN